MAAEFRLQDRWSTAREFLEAVRAYWGAAHYQLSASREIAMVRCPACRPPSRDWHDWPLLVHKAGVGWGHTAWCGCPDVSIAAELIRSQRDLLDAELEGLV